MQLTRHQAIPLQTNWCKILMIYLGMGGVGGRRKDGMKEGREGTEGLGTMHCHLVLRTSLIRWWLTPIHQSAILTKRLSCYAWTIHFTSAFFCHFALRFAKLPTSGSIVSSGFWYESLLDTVHPVEDTIFGNFNRIHSILAAVVCGRRKLFIIIFQPAAGDYNLRRRELFITRFDSLLDWSYLWSPSPFSTLIMILLNF